MRQRDWHDRKHVKGLFILLLLLFFCLSAINAKPVSVNDLKAIFLFHFASFVQWPENSFSGPNDSLHYCTVGNSRIHKLLRDVTKGERVKGRDITLAAVKNLDDVKKEQCHLVFVGNYGHFQDSLSLATLAKMNILTVGENPDFISNGGMINLKHVRKRVKIEVGLDNVKLSQLEISSKLLRLAILK